MEQRRLRLGDILDDYCPRERRVTNHAVVAMIDDDVKQTRCTTCDAEHPYKGGTAPRRRKKETAGALYKQVLEGMPETETPPVLHAASSQPPETEPAATPALPALAAMNDEPIEEISESAAAPDVESEVEPAEPPQPVEEGPVHRPLIRATLPRPEGQKYARPLPEFTVRQIPGRGNGHFRGGDARMKGRPGMGGGGGQRAAGGRPAGGNRFGGPRPAGNVRGVPGGRGQGGGFRPAQQPRRGGKKRSR
jgi:hypothetical protein